ncbi:hypothetical protein JDF658_10740 [Carboxydocella sp. JDF658]|nr:hypothetical protein ULO1_20930 [Carboxydocella sp. ULO1]GAW31309.1 hypothetical protein JDF658_10740 [Carboxydocella sp. JDF658]
MPASAPFVEKEMQKIINDEYQTTYLISYKNGLAKVDFEFTSLEHVKKIKDKNKYLLNEEKNSLPLCKI